MSRKTRKEQLPGRRDRSTSTKVRQRAGQIHKSRAELEQQREEVQRQQAEIARQGERFEQQRTELTRKAAELERQDTAIERAEIMRLQEAFERQRARYQEIIRQLVKQRTRWHQGFLQVLAKRDWLRIPGRRARLLALVTLSQPILDALTLGPVMFIRKPLTHADLDSALAMFRQLVPGIRRRSRRGV